jgi:hypothetical protein
MLSLNIAKKTFKAISFLKLTLRNYNREDIVTNEQMKKRLKEKIELRKNKSKQSFFNRLNPMNQNVLSLII